MHGKVPSTAVSCVRAHTPMTDIMQRHASGATEYYEPIKNCVTSVRHKTTASGWEQLATNFDTTTTAPASQHTNIAAAAAAADLRDGKPPQPRRIFVLGLKTLFQRAPSV